MLFPLYDENPTKRRPVVTLTIIVLNCLAFFYTQHLGRTQGAEAQNLFIAKHGFVPARLGQLVTGKPVFVNIAPPQVRQVGPRQVVFQPEKFLVIQRSVGGTLLALLTCMFLHGGWYHILSNMWFFYIFGKNIEDRLGHLSFLAFYLGGGLIATACHVMMTTGKGADIPVIGASGAVAATLGAYAIFYPWVNVRCILFVFVFFTWVDLPALFALGVWFVTQLVSGIEQLRFPMGTGVAWWAHIGGFLAGAALMPLVARPEPPRLPQPPPPVPRQRPFS